MKGNTDLKLVAAISYVILVSACKSKVTEISNQTVTELPTSSESATSGNSTFSETSSLANVNATPITTIHIISSAEHEQKEVLQKTTTPTTLTSTLLRNESTFQKQDSPEISTANVTILYRKGGVHKNVFNLDTSNSSSFHIEEQNDGGYYAEVRNFGGAEIRVVTTAEELQSAINTASPGDIINLGISEIPQENPAGFHCYRNGSTIKPITIQTTLTQAAIIGNGTGSAFNITGNNWILKGFKIANFYMGVHLKGGSNVVIDSVGIYDVVIGVSIVECQHSKRHAHNQVTKNLIEASKYGVQIGNCDYTEVSDSSIAANETAIISDDGSCCGILRNNLIYGEWNIEESYETLGNVINNYLLTNIQIYS